MKEIEVIKAIRANLKSSPWQRNRPFETDAELVVAGGRLLAFTADDFSAEDRITLDNPRVLGWNLAVGTLSDLLAVGAKPEFMLHSLVVSDAMRAEHLTEMSSGLQEALDAFGAFLLGGDIGRGEAWRYTGFGVGSFANGDQPLSRRTPHPEGLIVATGCYADANLAAAKGTPMPRFECRLEEGRRIARCGVACIDTSDGLVRALEMICELNAGVRLILDLDAVPYADGVSEAAAGIGARPEAFLLAGAGEYELMALVPAEAVEDILGTGSFAQIGRFERNVPSGLFYRLGSSEELIPHQPVPDPRDFANVEAYRGQVVALAEQLFG